MSMIDQMKGMLEKLGTAFVPKRFRPSIREYLFKAGYDDVPYIFFGVLFFAGAFLTIPPFLTLIWDAINELHPAYVFLLSFITWAFIQLLITTFIVTSVYFWLNIKIYQRTKELEDKLPDYLTLVVTNLKGGLSFEKSLWAAIKPQFGILAKEITIVSKKVMTGNDVTEALVEFAKKYNSPILRRSINLIISEIESGGKIVDVIDKVIENLRKTKNLKEEMAAATVSYMIFIGVIVVVIAPGLFALALQLLKIIMGFTSNLGTTQVVGGGGGGIFAGNFGSVTIDPDDFKIFSIMALTTVATFSSFIISIIERGDIKGGLRYTFAFIIGAITFYLIFANLLGSMFSGIL